MGPKRIRAARDLLIKLGLLEQVEPRGSKLRPTEYRLIHKA
jgi:hypothetical protein